MSLYESSLSMAYGMSATQKEYLVDHRDGSRPVRNVRAEIATRGALIQRKLIRYDQHHTITSRADFTVITERGRDVLCAIFAEWVEELLKAGLTFDSRPSELAASDLRGRILRELLVQRRLKPMEKIGYGRFVTRPAGPADGRNPVRDY